MPLKSKAQQGWMFATDPVMARRWARHTKDLKSLPERVGDSPVQEKKGFSMKALSDVAKRAAETKMVEKLARDTEITPELVQALAKHAGYTPSTFVKLAYDNPADYTIFLKVASGAVHPSYLTKGASAGALLKNVLAKMQQGGSAALSAGKAAVKSPTAQIGAGAGLAAGGGAALGVNQMTGQPPQGPVEAGTNAASAAMANAPKPGANPAQQGGAAAPPAQNNNPAPNPQPSTPPNQGSSSSTAKIGAGAAAGGALGFGLGAMAGRKKKPKPAAPGKEVTARDLAVGAMRSAIVKKAADLLRRSEATKLVGYLDKVAAAMPLEKTAQVRVLQSEVLSGRPLSYAIKKAYPQLNGEQRGIVASKLCRGAVGHYKRAVEEKRPFFKGKTSGRSEAVVPLSQGVKKMKEMSR